jgi:DNA-binding PadR family transcriptional regulator
MSVKHAVLGLVIERPGYGYELIQRVEERIGGREQLIQERDVRDRPAPAHRGVTWYEATAEGRAHFKEWMHGPLELAPLRDEIRIRIAFATVDELPHLVELTRELEAVCLTRIAELGHGGNSDELLDPEVEWHVVGQVWLRRTEADYLALTVETLQDVRWEMKQAIKRHERRTLGPHGRLN